MDKVIIDGVNVAGCFNLEEWEHCNICQKLIKTIPNRHQCLTEKELRCEFYTNCYYKQLKRLQAENEKLKIDIGIYKGIIDADKEENERLKARLRPLEDSYFNGLSSIEIAELAKKSIRITTENRKLEDALQEIKDIVERTDGNHPASVINMVSVIRHTINSVIGAEE